MVVLAGQRTLKPWPAPPPSTVGRLDGAYLSVKSDFDTKVKITEPGRGERPLYHYVDSSPTGFSWGYLGSGPTDLARSLLADRLGYVPARRIYFAFRDEVVGRLEDEFLLTFNEVDEWIDYHRALFAENPFAEPFDPYAGGGAYS